MEEKRNVRKKHKIIRSIFFFPLLTVRRIVLFILRTGSCVCLLCGIIAYFASRDGQMTTWSMIVLFNIGVICQVIGMMYDKLLLWLNPTEDELIFFR